MEKWLDIMTTLFALAAAVFWFLSAYGSLPQMVTYLGYTPENDPFYLAIKFSAAMNRYAAALSGLSALSMAIKGFIVHRRGRHGEP
jgi:hypothetical protein